MSNLTKMKDLISEIKIQESAIFKCQEVFVKPDKLVVNKIYE